MLEIIHQDTYILVVDKPTDIAVLPEGWTPDAPYLRKMLEEEYGKIWVVHRLDKTTSGVMVFARQAESHRHLNTQFEQHSVVKSYHAIVEGVPVWDEHTARHKLRLNVGKKHRTVVDHSGGKASETHFSTLKRGRSHSLLAAAPRTGRTHQVRVHAAALGLPLLGDTLYGAPESRLIARPALHAAALTFIHPATGDAVTFEAPYPTDFQAAIQALKF